MNEMEMGWWPRIVKAVNDFVNSTGKKPATIYFARGELVDAMAGVADTLGVQIPVGAVDREAQCRGFWPARSLHPT